MRLIRPPAVGDVGFLRIRVVGETDSTFLPGPKRQLMIVECVDRLSNPTGTRHYIEKNEFVSIETARRAVGGAQ